MAATDPVALVGTMGAAYLESRCLHVVADLGVADALGDGPRTLASLAGELGVDEVALGRIIRHLASLGVFDFQDGTVHPNAASQLLRSDDPSGMLALTRMFALPIMWDSLRSLEGSVRTGRPGASFSDPDGFFAYLDRHPEESLIYDEGMTSMTLRRIDRIVRTMTSPDSASSPMSVAGEATSFERSSTGRRTQRVFCSIGRRSSTVSTPGTG